MIATDMSSASEGTGILFNLDGEVIGMISSDIWKDRGVRTANAYAISDLKLVIQLLANGASVPYTGVSGTAVTSGIQKEEGMPSGIYVIDVAADSPAMAAGIQSGDVICSVNGEKIVSMSAYRKPMPPSTTMRSLMRLASPGCSLSTSMSVVFSRWERETPRI